MTSFIRVLLVLACAVAPASARTWAVAHAPMRSGTIASAQNFDVAISLQYVSALDFGTHAASGGQVQVDIYLFDADGSPMLGAAGTSICAPCTFPMGPGVTQRTVRLDALVQDAGGFPAEVIGPSVIVDAAGDRRDLEQLVVQGMVLSTGETASDLRVSVFQPVELRTRGR